MGSESRRCHAYRTGRTNVGFALQGGDETNSRPQSLWPRKTDIDRPLVIGSALFGVGWGLVGLCPGPALENLATLSPRVIVFVVAMAAGMMMHDLWQTHRAALTRLETEPAMASNG